MLSNSTGQQDPFIREKFTLDNDEDVDSMPNRHLADTGLAKFIVPPPKDFSCSKQIATSFISGPPKMTIHPIKPYFIPCVGTNYGYMIADMYKLFILTTLF